MVIDQFQASEGGKTRVRAGPFTSREEAEMALEKMKQIGIAGVISGK
jgi:DedD protein